MVLATISVLSVLVINYAAGDYGIQMLYYRNFLGTPLAPGEMIVQFTARQYLRFFLTGFKSMLNSYVPLFLVLGLIGLNRKTAPLLAVAITYAGLHYLTLPNWMDRWMAILYLLTCMTAAYRVRLDGAVSQATEDLGMMLPSGRAA